MGPQGRCAKSDVPGWGILPRRSEEVTGRTDTRGGTSPALNDPLLNVVSRAGTLICFVRRLTSQCLAK